MHLLLVVIKRSFLISRSNILLSLICHSLLMNSLTNQWSYSFHSPSHPDSSEGEKSYFMRSVKIILYNIHVIYTPIPPLRVRSPPPPNTAAHFQAPNRFIIGYYIYASKSRKNNTPSYVLAIFFCLGEDCRSPLWPCQAIDILPIPSFSEYLYFLGVPIAVVLGGLNL